MSTSDRQLPLEAAAAAAVVVAVVALASPGDLWLRGMGLHPAWLPVIVLAARYGPRGLFMALAFTWGGLMLASAALGGSVDGLGAHGHRGADVVALIASTLVAWVGMMHQSRLARVTSRLADTSELQAQAETMVGALHDGLAYLRTRHDRVDIALSLWRNLAGRIEGGHTADAADAALELCTIRTGARSGYLALHDGARSSIVAARGPRPAVSGDGDGGDRTVRGAVVARAVTLAGVGSTAADSAVVAPVFDPATGVVIGVIALRGVQPGALRTADLRDLAVIGQWLAPSLVRALTTTRAARVNNDRRA